MTETNALTVEDLGTGEPPPEMVERFGMEAVPEDGDSDEVEGEVLDPDEAERESEDNDG